MFGRKTQSQTDDCSSKRISAERTAPIQAVEIDPVISTTRQPIKAEHNQARELLLTELDPLLASRLSKIELEQHIVLLFNQLADRQRWIFSEQEQASLISSLLDDMLGIGPIQGLLDDPSITDIMVNGADQVYVEKAGRLQKASAVFRDEKHLRHVAQRIASFVGRRIDESSPMVDARLSDGSRVNIIIPPLALDGTCISIRKFSEHKMSLFQLADAGSLSHSMAEFLQIAAKARLNILVSGGTGAGKTTLLNALSDPIEDGERIVTIEDAAELKLQQSQVIRLETRPPSLEGTGEVNQRDLVRNALRMNPRRIILGEVRGAEAFDMLQAMNTGHEGSMSTLHANSARDAIYRLENMLLMGQQNLPISMMRRQIMSSIDLIIQVERMRDGKRRIVEITELVGLEDDTPITQNIFEFQLDESQGDIHQAIQGQYTQTASLNVSFLEKIRYAGLAQEFERIMKGQS
jgi:pilus assembly protein CpaF